jgi:hypothetical protein
VITIYGSYRLVWASASTSCALFIALWAPGATRMRLDVKRFLNYLPICLRYGDPVLMKIHEFS